MKISVDSCSLVKPTEKHQNLVKGKCKAKWKEVKGQDIKGPRKPPGGSVWLIFNWCPCCLIKVWRQFKPPVLPLSNSQSSQNFVNVDSVKAGVKWSYQLAWGDIYDICVSWSLVLLFKGTYCESCWYTQGLRDSKGQCMKTQWERPPRKSCVRKLKGSLRLSSLHFCWFSYNLPAILYIHAFLHMCLQVIGSRKALPIFLQRSKTENTLFFIHGFMKTELFCFVSEMNE